MVPTEHNSSFMKGNKRHTVHILIVDDDEQFGGMLADVINTMTDFDCTFVPNAKKALEALNDIIFEVVITDLNMPDISGLELTRIIKTTYESDVIIITGYYKDFTYKDAFGIGASDFIKKPVNPTDLISRLYNVLKKRNVSTNT